jgi:hypothetical protein
MLSALSGMPSRSGRRGDGLIEYTKPGRTAKRNRSECDLTGIWLTESSTPRDFCKSKILATDPKYRKIMPEHRSIRLFG